MTPKINLDRLMRELHQLATMTECAAAVDPSLPQPQRAVTRIVFTPRDLEARAWFKNLAIQAGFAVREDAVGNTFVRWAGSRSDLPAIGTGSHMDAIPFAGMYDGTVGVLGGLEAMRALKEAGFAPHRSLELLLLTSEEPTRFGIGCLGSRLLSGVLKPEAADALQDRLQATDAEALPGGTLRSARQAAGFNGSLSTVRAQPGLYDAWIELHIEQGPLLERASLNLGVVTHIAGPASYRFSVEGVGGHAGALLMPDRRDALCASAELVLAIERFTLQANRSSGTHNSVATVGKLEVYPGAVNAVPSRVNFMLDIRDTNVQIREAIMGQIRGAAQEVSERRKVLIREERINADPPAHCDRRLVNMLMEEAAVAGATAEELVSRAYHDTSFMAQIAPVAMLFIACRGGVSHGADEYASPEAIALGTRVLAQTMARLSVCQATPSHPARGVD